MSWIYGLLIIELILLCMAWSITNGDLSSISVVVVLVMLVSTFFNIYAIDLWDDSTFYFETVLAVALGLSAVVLAEMFGVVSIKRSKIRTIDKFYGLKEINISNVKVLLVTSVCVIFTVLYYFNIRIVAIKNGLDVASAISMIKSNYKDTNMRLNVFVRQGYKFITAFSYVSAFVFINNCMVLKKKLKRNVVHLIPIVCLVVVCTLSGGRVDIIRLLSAAFIFYMILMREKRGWTNRGQKETNKKILKIAIPIIIIIAVFLTQLRSITKGNISSNQLTSIIDYVAYYIGGPLQVLNIKIHKGILNYRLDYFGELTFRGFWNFISRYGFTKMYIPLNLSSYEYLLIHLGIGGNVDTFMGPPLFDFGYIGAFILVFFEYYIVIRYYYRKIAYTNASYRRNRRLLIFGFCYFIVTMSYYENCMYTVLSFTGIMSLAFMLLGYWFYFKCRI